MEYLGGGSWQPLPSEAEDGEAVSSFIPLSRLHRVVATRGIDDVFCDETLSGWFTSSLTGPALNGQSARMRDPEEGHKPEKSGRPVVRPFGQRRVSIDKAKSERWPRGSDAE